MVCGKFARLCTELYLFVCINLRVQKKILFLSWEFLAFGSDVDED